MTVAINPNSVVQLELSYSKVVKINVNSEFVPDNCKDLKPVCIDPDAFENQDDIMLQMPPELYEIWLLQGVKLVNEYLNALLADDENDD